MITTMVKELKAVEQQTGISTIKMKADLEQLIEAGALIQYKGEMEKVLTLYRNDISNETEEQKRLISQFNDNQSSMIQQQ